MNRDDSPRRDSGPGYESRVGGRTKKGARGMIIIARPPPLARRNEMVAVGERRSDRKGRDARGTSATSHMMPMKPPLWASPLAGVPLSLRQKTDFQTGAI